MALCTDVINKNSQKILFKLNKTWTWFREVQLFEVLNALLRLTAKETWCENQIKKSNLHLGYNNGKDKKK